MRRRCTLTTVNSKGDSVTMPLIITRFFQDLDMDISRAQRRGGVSNRPIRIAERFLDLSCAVAVQHEDQYDLLCRRIIAHWVYTLNVEPIAMVFRYPGYWKWRGFIDQVPRRRTVTDVLLQTDFRFRIINKTPRHGARIIGQLEPFIPTIRDIQAFGPEWFTIKELSEEARSWEKTVSDSSTTPQPPQPPARHRHHK
jgi:hypothetical protein